MSHMHAALRTSELRVQGQKTYPMLSMVGRLISFWRPRASRSYSASWGCPSLPFTLACSIRQAALSSSPWQGAQLDSPYSGLQRVRHPVLKAPSACSMQMAVLHLQATASAWEGGPATHARLQILKGGQAEHGRPDDRFRHGNRPEPQPKRQGMLPMHNCQS